VASRAIAKRLRESLSAASVRNIMADLDEEGYLSQPHTSAGRIPTEKAFRSYIKSLTVRRLVQTELERIRQELGRVDTVQARVEKTSHLLMEMTRGLAIAAAIPTLSQTLDQVDLLALADRRVLMVVATRDHMVHNRVVGMNEAVSAEELQEIRNYINHNFSGWLLDDIRRELERRLSEERATYDSVLKRLQLLYQQGVLDFDLNPQVHFDGASNLIGLDLHLTQEKMRDLFRALEQKKKILHLLDRFLEEPHGEVAVRVGLGEAHPSMSELAIIGINLQLPGGAAGKFAVVGPMRMDYGRVISAVLHVGQAFQSARA
jgi:heat-inducible transcriptional repressor